jgi:hypothetical protein
VILINSLCCLVKMTILLVRFSDPECSWLFFHSLNVFNFPGRVITAAYVPLINYHSLFPDAMTALQLLMPSAVRRGLWKFCIEVQITVKSQNSDSRWNPFLCDIFMCRMGCHVKKLQTSWDGLVLPLVCTFRNIFFLQMYISDSV